MSGAAARIAAAVLSRLPLPERMLYDMTRSAVSAGALRIDAQALTIAPAASARLAAPGDQWSSERFRLIDTKVNESGHLGRTRRDSIAVRAVVLAPLWHRFLFAEQDLPNDFRL